MLHNHPAAAAELNQVEVGRIVEVAGAAARVSLDARMLRLLATHPDASIAGTGRVATHLKVKIAGVWAVAAVRALRLVEADGDLILGEADFIGEGDDEDDTIVRFRRGVTHLPMPGARLQPVSTADLKSIFAADERPHVEIGTVYPTDDIRVALQIDPLLGRHFAILGSTGTGKSTATALILHRLIQAAPEGHVLMIDPHGEYAASFGDAGAAYDVANLAMPYWLMNLEEHAELFVTARGPERQGDIDILAKTLLAARTKSRAAEGISRLTADSPVPYLLSDLSTLLSNDMGKLDKATGAAPYQRLRARIEELKVDPRYGFLISGMMAGDTMASFLSRMLRLPGEGKPISIVDLSGVPSEITGVVVAVLARMVFDHGLWSRGEASRPVLLVCEEAHRYIPESGAGPARAVLERIAKEGRKYGVSLGLVTQRPSDLAQGVLSQCGTIIAMRLNNERDQAQVRAAIPEGARGLVDAIPALRNREAVVCGEGVAIPFRVALDELEDGKLPASHDPSFAAAWQDSGDEAGRLERTIKRWRKQGR